MAQLHANQPYGGDPTLAIITQKIANGELEVPWSGVVNTPTSAEGFGIADTLNDDENLDWSRVQNAPTTLGGYGITDGTALGSTAGAALAAAAAAGSAVTAARSDHAHKLPTFASILSKPTTLAGFGIGDMASALLKTAAELNNNTTLVSGFYVTNSGILNPDGSVFKPDWWHVLNFKHLGDDGYNAQIALDLSSSDSGGEGAYLRFSSSGVWTAWRRLFHEGNDGTGSNLDADLLDGLHASAFARLTSNTFSGRQAQLGNDKGGVAMGVATFSLLDGNYQKMTLTGNASFTIADWAPAGTYNELMLELVNAGNFILGFPTILWTMPSSHTTYLTLTAYLTALGRSPAALKSNGVEYVYLWSTDGGATVYGKII